MAPSADGPRRGPRSLPQSRSSGVLKRPATAVAVVTAGDTRCVRPPLPWRPSKLRFDVDAHRSTGGAAVGVHREAHRAAGVAPLEARRRGTPRAALRPRPRPSPASSPARRAPACRRGRGGPRTTAAAREVFDARVRARADEHGVDCDVADRGARLQAHVRKRAACAVALDRVGEAVGARDDVVDRDRHPGLRSPRDRGSERGGVEEHFLVESRIVVGDERAPVLERALPRRARRRVLAGLRRTRTLCRPARPYPRAPASIDMLQTVMRPSIESAADRVSRGTR